MKSSGLSFIRIIIGIFSIFAVVMIGYQLYKYNFVSIKTEDAVMGEMEEVVKGKAIFFRKEEVVDNGGYHYLDVVRTEAERVSGNGTIARVYSSESSAMIQKEIRSVEAKIKTYEDVLENSGSYESAAKGIDQAINSNLKKIAASSLSGSSAAFEISDDLTINIMKSKIASGDLVGYDKVLDALKSELSALRAKGEASEKTIKSNGSGYFSLLTDGLESQLTLEILSDINVDNFQETLDLCKNPSADQNAVGKMVYDNAWSLCMKVKTHDIFTLETNDTVYIRIPGFSSERIKCTVSDIRKSGEEAVIVLTSSVINDNILTLRSEDIHLILETHSGIRLRHSALRKVNGEDGVFVKVGLLLKYKKVNVLYNDGVDAIVEYVAIDEKGIRVHDQVVYKGSGLYNGKAVS